MKCVYDTMLNWSSAEPLSLTGLLTEANVTSENYEAVLKISTKYRGCKETSKRTIYQ